MISKNKKLTIFILSFVILISVLVKFNNYNNSNIATNSFVNSNIVEKEELTKVLENIFNDRCSMFISGDLTNLPKYFDTSQKLGKYSLEHEVCRIKYFRDWYSQRQMNFLDIHSTVNIRKITPNKKGVRLLVDEFYKFQYIYKNDDIFSNNNFGVGIIHTIQLVKKQDNWIIHSDWYTDCFEDALKAYSGEIKEFNLPSNDKPIFNLGNYSKEPSKEVYVKKGKYNRAKAVAYADKYCGIPWGSGDTQKYNKRYLNFTGIGGNCTNYVSQAIGDEDGGALKFDNTWYCIYKKYAGAQGSKAWVNADAFKDYLLYSGRGKLIKRGTFISLISPTPNFPNGAVQNLQIGDVICYAKGTDIDHFAIVTSFDSHGYPLINSHTTDRYHVPWDLGWGDKNISFYFIHVK